MIHWGKFKSHSGLELPFKIECDDLTDNDWETLAKIVATRLSYKRAIGVPRGGLKFANALNKYRKPGSSVTLIVDDVFTTGKSMEEAKKGVNYAAGIVLFARSQTPDWILPIFSMHPMWRIERFEQNEKLEECKQMEIFDVIV